jgi:hypothetical protein
MSGPNFNDLDAFFDCANAVYRTPDSAWIAVRHLGRDGWRIEECSWLEDEQEGTGVWVTDEELTVSTTRACVAHLRALGAQRVRSVFDA